MKVFFAHDQLQKWWPYLVPDAREGEPRFRHFLFVPPRPANLLVTLDRLTGEVNVSAGTVGPLSWDPYTIVIHCNKSSLDSVNNIQQVGAECVIGLPGADLITQTWITAFNMPRGVNEGRLARLTMVPSKLIATPSIAECPINYECVVESYREQHSHYIAFLRVLGASVDERVFAMSHEEAGHAFPTWEVDDVENEWGGGVERLGMLGEFLPTPSVRPARGWGAAATDWLADLGATGELTARECAAARALVADWERVMAAPQSFSGTDKGGLPPERYAVREALKRRVTQMFALLAWGELDALRQMLQEV